MGIGLFSLRRHATRASVFGAGLAVAASVLVAVPVPAEAADTSVEITYPTQGDVIDVGDMELRGRIDTEGSEEVSVVYAVDVSGSTSSGSHDCDKSGGVDGGDDLNSDGTNGDVLDCEISGLIALNASIAAIPGADQRIEVGLVPFGSSAAIADVSGNTGDQNFIAPSADEDDDDRERTADVVQAFGSLDQGRIDMWATRSVGTGTSFTAALSASANLLTGRQGRKIVFLLTDGYSSISGTTLEQLAAAGVEVRTYAVSSSSDRCADGGALDQIADFFAVPCTYAPDPTALSAVISGQPSTIDRVEVSIDGGNPVTAVVDPLGNFTAGFALSAGSHTAVATAHFTDGSHASDSVTFSAETGIRYVALGDSYSAGEGLTPYFEVPGPKRGCHQSTQGPATHVGTTYPLPVSQQVNLDYVACSGAVVKNVTGVRQRARGETHIVQLDRVGPDADLVAFTIGGNDVAFSEVLAHCATQIHCYDDGFARLTSGRSLTLREWLEVRLALFLPEVESVYRQVRERAGSGATVVAMDYPEIMDDGTALRLGCFEGSLFDRAEREFLDEQVVRLSQGLSTAAGNAGVWFGSVIDEFKGHRVCDGGVNTQSEWLVGVETSTKLAGDASFHPDSDGAEAYARVLTEQLEVWLDAGAATTPSGLPHNPTPAVGADANSVGPEPVGIAQATTVLDGFTTAELEEIEAMRFESAEAEGLSWRRGSDICASRVARGEHLVISGTGFAPNTPLTIEAKAASEADARSQLAAVTTDADGNFETGVIVPADLLPTAGRAADDPWTAFGLRISGTGPEGAQRTLSDVMAIDPPTGTCTAQIAAAGDISVDGGAAPSAASTPGVPAQLVTFPEALGDGVSVTFSGTRNHTVAGELSDGNVGVTTDVLGVQRVGGGGTLAGSGTAVYFDVNRFWIFPLYFGTVTVRDPAAGMNVQAPVWFGSVAQSADTVTGRFAYPDFSTFPFGFVDVSFSVSDRR